MRLGPALAILVPSSLVLVVSAFGARGRPRRAIHDLPVAVAGAGIGLGALLFQRDVSAAGWIVTPALTAGLAVLHVRALFRGGGPLRV